ncbi:neuronal growth regulator 1-like [Frieseomelitta varia]|uniref:neuronal growth regulator 1-like n=1 Tax=Frieseomelitta varia TaxID=561572 RepID=UPI001CB6A346|nr:neuronal growth regulator 1-like [Frieseomelitta varia]
MATNSLTPKETIRHSAATAAPLAARSLFHSLTKICAHDCNSEFNLFKIVSFCIIIGSVSFNERDLPRFGTPLNNLTVSVGREAVFTCIVENLGPYKVAWLRVDTQTILTIATHVITKNHRIAVTHSGHRRWCLHIRDTKETDRGWYMCQVNTDPMSSNTGFLEVVVPPDILDDSTSTDMEVQEGSNVTLRCAATGTPKPKVTWRREIGGTIAQSNSHEGTHLRGCNLISRDHGSGNDFGSGSKDIA